MKLLSITAVLFIACFAQACRINSTEGQGSLLSDGYISYSINGVPFIAHDSLMAGDPSNFELSGFDLDSSLSISGKGIRFFVAHCFDTGTYLLTVASYADVLFEDTVWSVYWTDSIHTGLLHLTQFDLTKKSLAGTFTFLAQKDNGSTSDTVRVVNGTLYNFPLNRN
ncbi:MAG TPA: DUF6252 family protein [Candidatus Kapabacteria bacterium]|nr:DUF6252 family protein [Candidatus Kapabacteria bacterium]